MFEQLMSEIIAAYIRDKKTMRVFKTGGRTENCRRTGRESDETLRFKENYEAGAGISYRICKDKKNAVFPFS
jgi:hypothetical protein